MKNFKIKLLIIFSCVFLTMSCVDLPSDNTVSEDVFEPEFKTDRKAIYSDIKTISNSEEIWMEGYKFFKTNLNVQLINPRNLSENKDSLKAMQKKVASTLKNLLKDSKQFQEYNIIFIRRDTVKENLYKAISEKALYNQTFKESDL